MAEDIQQLIVSYAPATSSLENRLPDPVIRLLSESAPQALIDEPLLVNTRLPIPESAAPEPVRTIVNEERLNNVRYINKFLESANRLLPEGGLLIGHVETSGIRKQRILKVLPRPLNKVYYAIDYLVVRVWPKMPYLRKLYFALTGGQNRVISEMETWGRLYACGFRLVDSVEDNGLRYFIAAKTGEPAYNMEATYGPLIKLRRVSKNGKIIKVYKFRTMSPYSEYIQAFIYERNGYDGGAKFRDDFRITTLGHFLRKYWLDELPMLYNLLRGDVKLFGVRPVSAHYLSLFSPEFQAFRKKFKPGLIPPVYVEIPQSLEEIEAIEWRYLKAYESAPLRTDLRYMRRFLYNIFIKMVRSH